VGFGGTSGRLMCWLIHDTASQMWSLAERNYGPTKIDRIHLTNSRKRPYNPLPSHAEVICVVRVPIAIFFLVSLSFNMFCSAGRAFAQAGAQAEILPDASGQGGRVRASILIPTSPEIVWAVMLDCAGASRFVPGLRSCKIESRAPDGLSDERSHRISWLPGFPTVSIRFASRYRLHREIRFQRISGDIAAMSGTWALTPQNEGQATFLTYEAHLVPSRILPSALVRSALKRDTPKILDAVRREAIAHAAHQK